MSNILSAAILMEVHNVILAFLDFHLHKEHYTLLFHIDEVLIGPYIAIFVQISNEALTRYTTWSITCGLQVSYRPPYSIETFPNETKSAF